MTRLALVAFLGGTGCYVQARGAVAVPVNGRGAVRGGPAGELDVGFGGDDGTQGGAIYMGGAVASIRGDGAGDAAPVWTAGGRYERMLSARRPWLRGYGRLGLGAALCFDDDGNESPCRDDPESAAASLFDLGVGIAITKVGDPGKGITGPVGTVSLGVVYSYQARKELGAADFVGLELGVATGGDWITPIFDAPKHD